MNASSKLVLFAMEYLDRDRDVPLYSTKHQITNVVFNEGFSFKERNKITDIKAADAKIELLTKQVYGILIELVNIGLVSTLHGKGKFEHVIYFRLNDPSEIVKFRLANDK
jgi:hypothetical protein